MTQDKINKGNENIQAWFNGVKPEHSSIVIRVDALIREIHPDIFCTTKWHKPSQPLGIPFYGLLDKGWMFAMWSFKDSVGVGFIAGTLLDPQPPIAKMAGPWNRSTEYKARRIDINNNSELDEELLRSWFTQAKNLPGWSKIK
ncbi:DUF1801 domain-containing protein [Flavobacterium sp.]|uniref:DUF1801 domain-containing protein n=1 Tax=Flavobacterium sp. TaxID=239 RepID=UPI002BCD39FF|nr:DUF1801 domain-containing protein [Flavobacterium sp.]HSD06558.1 DUF1801 domain-containing protein [Flavobacterium sp.]